METSPPRDTLKDVMDLQEVARERLETLRPSALVEALRRRVTDQHGSAPVPPEGGTADPPASVGAGFNSAL
jgi:hypothetical protein